jgi:hypothetical protein
MDKVIAVTSINGKYQQVECLFIAHYRMESAHQRCLLHCPSHKITFYHTLKNIKHGKVIEGTI